MSAARPATLETFIEHDGQIAEAAKQLYIQRNTAAYRLEKISELLGIDFKKVNDLLRLKLAFLFRHRIEGTVHVAKRASTGEPAGARGSGELRSAARMGLGR
ncbi:helix-turn-helix domain-containing protein [Paenibacillus sp. y28]